VSRLPALLLAAALSGACASSGAASLATSAPVAPPLRMASFDEVLGAWDTYCHSLDTLRASGELEVRDLRTGKARSLGVRLAAGRGGRLYIKGSIAVVTALEVVSDGQRFWFQVPSKKTVWTGRAGGGARPEASDEQAPYHVLRPSDVLQGLLPEPLVAGADEVVVLDATRETYGLSLSRPQGGRGTLQRRVLLDRASLRPTGVRYYDGVGEVAAEVALEVGEDGSPRRVSITRPREGYFARLTLGDVQRGGALPEQAFVPRSPEGYAVVDVDEEKRP
jgi:hypothetical protein